MHIDERQQQRFFAAAITSTVAKT